MKVDFPGGGGGGFHIKSDGDARRKIKIKPLRETNVGAVLAKLTPKGDHTKQGSEYNKCEGYRVLCLTLHYCVASVTAIFVNFFMHSLK